jgi:curved DNA-binding protein CbpA
MDYFVGCKNIDEVKDRYKKWSKILHPDLGGNEEHFKIMSEQYNGLLNNKKKKKEKAPKAQIINDKNQNNNPEFFVVANNLIELIRQGVYLAKDINMLINESESKE